jgi:hypothetical protein
VSARNSARHARDEWRTRPSRAVSVVRWALWKAAVRPTVSELITKSSAATSTGGVVQALDLVHQAGRSAYRPAQCAASYYICSHVAVLNT